MDNYRKYLESEFSQATNGVVLHMNRIVELIESDPLISSRLKLQVQLFKDEQSKQSKLLEELGKLDS